MTMTDITVLLEGSLGLVTPLLAALVCGLLLGYERQKRGKPVGILTAVLVTVGSTLFVVGGNLIHRTDPSLGDPSRMASMIVSGIGFIGAGAIMRSKFSVTGLASAATIWTLGALGVLIGWGHGLLAISAAVVIFILMQLIPILEHRLFAQRYCVHVDVVVRESCVDQVLALAVDHQLAPPSAVGKEGGLARLSINECGGEPKAMFLAALRGLDGVVEVHVPSRGAKP